MENMASLWSYQESIDELKQKLLYTTIELESVKVEANEEMKKNREYVKQLLQLLKTTCQERDEARGQIQKLVQKAIPSAEFLAALPQIQPTKANSSITESNSLSDTYNYHSHGSSPVESFFNAVSSAELSHIPLVDSGNATLVNQPLVQASSATPKIDQASLLIEEIGKGKALPQKGKFLQAVVEAGPLLETLLVAGPLPRWRNPPPLHSFNIPPVSVKSCEAETVDEANGASLVFGQKTVNSVPFVGMMSCGSSQMFSTKQVLNFAGCGGYSSSPAGANANSYVPLAKRQRY